MKDQLKDSGVQGFAAALDAQWFLVIRFHREDVWTNPVFQQMLARAVAWAAGDSEADVKANFSETAPEASTMPPEK